MPSSDDPHDLEGYWADVQAKPALPPFLKGATRGERYNRAMEVLTQADADQEFERIVTYVMRYEGLSRAAAEKQERESLGYYSGYFSDETRARVQRLFKAVHPVFGPTADQPPATSPTGRRTSPIYCEHANEMPNICPCDDLCYCKDHSCKKPFCSHMTRSPSVCSCGGSCPCRDTSCRDNHRNDCGCRRCSGSF